MEAILNRVERLFNRIVSCGIIFIICFGFFCLWLGTVMTGYFKPEISEDQKKAGSTETTQQRHNQPR